MGVGGQESMAGGGVLELPSSSVLESAGSSVSSVTHKLDDPVWVTLGLRFLFYKMRIKTVHYLLGSREA